MLGVKIKMDKENKSGFKKEIKISSYFAFLTSVLIAVIVILTMGYVLRFVKNISSDYSGNIKRFNYVISSLVFQLYSDTYNDGSKDYTKLNKTVTTLKSNDLLSYVYVTDNHTNRIIWASEDNLKNKHIIDTGRIIDKNFGLKNVQEIQGAADHYTITIGLTQGRAQNNNIHIMFENMKIFVFILLFFGLLASAMMSRIINSPLIKLTQGVKEFAGGNFNYRLKETKFGEINELVQAYNTMAAQLQELYSSLEQKVQERTLELEKTNNDLKEAQAMMVHSEKMRSLGELVAGIAHEINNPINFIYGNITVPSTQERINSLMSSFRKSISISFLIFSISILLNRITVHKNYEENLPKIEAYGGQINQVFMNVLDNAAAAIDGNGDVYIDVKKIDETVEIKFRDTGKGIKKENLSKVFDPFFTTKPVGQGTGLGMSISYRVIQNHFGKISVESEVGQGATFTIVLPINHKQA